MRTAGRLWTVLLFGLLLSAFAASAGGAPVDRVAGVIEPRIVIQFGHQAPVVAVRWVNSSRDLVTLAEDGSLVVWDVAGRAIIDVTQLPGNWSGDASTRLLLQSFTPAADGKSFTLIYQEVPNSGPTKSGAERIGNACPVAARRTGGWCTFAFDAASRAVTADQAVATPAAPVALGSNSFPLSPDGRWRPVTSVDGGPERSFDLTDDHLQFDSATCTAIGRCRYGVNLIATDGGGATIVLAGDPRSYFCDADISADGARVVRIECLKNKTRARTDVLNLANGSREQGYVPDRAYHRVQWLGDGRFALSSLGYTATNDTEEATAGFPAVQLVDPECARKQKCAGLAAYGNMEALDDKGGFIGIGDLGGCYRNANSDTGTWCFNDDPLATTPFGRPVASVISLHRGAAGDWQPAVQPAWQGQTITAIKLSPDKRQLAVATRAWSGRQAARTAQTLRVWLLDVDDGALRAPRLVSTISNAGSNATLRDDDAILGLGFTPDGTRIVFSQAAGATSTDSTLHVVDISGAAPPLAFAHRSHRVMPAGNDRIIGLDNRELIDAATGSVVARLPGSAALTRAGYIAASKLVWTASDDGRIEFWDSATGDRQLTLYLLPDNGFFAIAPGGRYDTNLGPDSGVIRWLVADAPWQSLGPQTFMRDFYEPRLYQKLLDCRAANTCADSFKPLPSIASLNRVLPTVKITGVRQGKDAGEALVSFEVSEGFDPRAANGKTRSGIFNPRLFRDGRVVFDYPSIDDPADPRLVQETMADWRKRTIVTPDPKQPKSETYEFPVRLPTKPGSETQMFSVYAFNEDRIKSDTASFTYTRPPLAPRKPRAFVVTIGIDDYDKTEWRLNFAVNDARLMAARLHDIPGYEMRRLTLAGERTPDGTRRRVDNTTIMRVLSLLMTSDGRAAGLARLRDEEGIDAAMLEAATPDDIVIVSFSGHGWADAQGNFYLVTTNGFLDEKTGGLNLHSAFATAELTMYFSQIDAAEITLIIDACHSAASVATANFKPGPMGDSGLGQLAFDKGLRILAATQADDVAMESANLGQGLLSYALAAEGLTATGGKADLDGDGKIRLDEWLNYAVQRMPSLGEDSRLGLLAGGAGAGRAIVFNDLPAGAPKRRVQQPSLFDFNAKPAAVILRDPVR